MTVPGTAEPLVTVIPVKRLADAKGRLADVLRPIDRRVLAIAMLEDVVAAVQATDGLGAPVVVSPDPEVWHRADALGCRVVEEPPDADGGLNGALQRAAAGTPGTLLVVSADLPLASPAALGRVRDALTAAPVVVVPNRSGTGTNVLGWNPGTRFAPSFGPGSAARHLAAPGAVRVDDPDLADDVDLAEDLRTVVLRLDEGTVTARQVRALRLTERLGTHL